MATNIDYKLACKIIDTGSEGVVNFLNSGITPDMLIGEGRVVLSFVLSFWKKYSAIPSKEIISEKTKGVYKPEAVSEPVSYWIDEIKKRVLYNVIKNGLKPVMEHMDRYEPQKAFEAVMALGRGVWKDLPNMSNIESIFSLGPKIKELYLKIKAGEKGIPTPWPTMDNMTLGWWPGDLITCAARLGVGKTFALLLIAHKAWVSGYRVLFVCTEMSRLKIAQRFYSIHLKYPTDNIRKAKLGHFEEEAFFKSIDDLLEEKDFYVVGDDFKVDMDVIEGAIYKVNPHFLLVDGIWLVRMPGAYDRTTRVSMAVDELKILAKNYGLACCISSQFNRKVKKDNIESVDIENLSLSDAVGWNSDLAFGLVQTTDMKQDKKMLIKLLKLRDGDPRDIDASWNFDTMDFDEVESSVDGDFEDEEKTVF